MIDSYPIAVTALATQPTRQLRWLDCLTRWLFRSLVLLWLMAGLGAAVLHGWIVPRVGDFLPLLEQQAQQALGVPVRIGSIRIEAKGLQAHIVLGNVVLQSPVANTSQTGSVSYQGLRLGQITATLSLSSSWQMGFSQLLLDEPDLEVRRTLDGHIHVGGIDLFQSTGMDSSEAAHWLLSQPELVIRGGSVRWTDELNAMAPVQLQNVQGVLRNKGRKHLMRLDATLPQQGDGQFSLQGSFRQPLLSLRNDRFRDWSGQAYAKFDSVDLAQLMPFVVAVAGIQKEMPALSQASGQGSLHAWADISEGKLVGGVADVALQQASLLLSTPSATTAQPLLLDALTVRLEGKRVSETGGFSVSTQALQLRLPALQNALQDGSMAFEYQPAQTAGAWAQSQIKAEQLDLAAWAAIVPALPLEEAMQAQLAALAPQGLLHKLEARWQHPASPAQESSVAGSTFSAAAADKNEPTDTVRESHSADKSLPHFSVKAVVTGLAVAAVPASLATKKLLAHPGFSGINLELQTTHEGGQASVRMQNGQLELPGVFENPQVPLDQLSADVRWTVGKSTAQADPAIDVQVRNLTFANADMQGQAQVGWHTGTAASSAERFPGTLAVQGTLSRADGARVWRYLPKVLPDHTRRYVQEAVVRGQLSDVAFVVKGPIHAIPFNAAPESGVFKISAKVRDGQLAYVPTVLQPPGSLPWPALTGLRGDLLFNQASLEIENISASGVAGFPDIQVQQAKARIANMAKNAAVEVEADLRGPLASALALVQSSPLAKMTGQALAGVTATEKADFRLRLNLPVHDVDKTQVEGSITLPGNDIAIEPGAPVLARTRGTVQFNERGFSIAGAQARVLGGDVQIDGGSVRSPAGSGGAGSASTSGILGVSFKARGTLTAEGLRQALPTRPTGQAGQSWAAEANVLQRLARQASGSTGYTASISSSVHGGRTDIQWASNLQGLALALPEPLGKTAETSLPLRFEKLALAGPGRPEKISFNLDSPASPLVSLTVLRDADSAGLQGLRGSLGVGLKEGESSPPPMPQGAVLPGIAANIRLEMLDVDAWQKLLFAASESPSLTAGGVLPSTDEPVKAAASAPASELLPGLFPTSLALRVGQLRLAGYRFNNVVLGASRSATAWRANMDAAELSGYAEYRLPTGALDQEAGQVYARLQRLNLPSDTAKQVESLLSGQPISLPSLDIVIQALELRGKKLGRIDIDAVNRLATDRSGNREWRLNRFNALIPEAALTASGTWGVASGAGVQQSLLARRTGLDFKLDIQDSGALLARLGMPDVIRRGKGMLQGSIGWNGSPLALHHPSLSGQVQLKIESGQFMKADPGIAKLLSVLSLQALPRRLALDFRDVFTDGFAFDFVQGDIAVDKGLASTRNMQMKGVNAAVLMEGYADIARETQDLSVVVVPEINAGTASLIATAINPLVGLGSFMAQWLLRKPLMEAATQTFHISGSWQDPKVVKVSKNGMVVQK